MDPEALTLPLTWKKPSRIFVNSMSDLFHPEVPFAYIRQMFDIMARTPQHRYLILTKRPERMTECLHALWRERSDPQVEFSHVWLGVSIESRAYLGRADVLRSIPAAVRFLSLEPLLEDLGALDLTGMGWVIVGGESGPRAKSCEIAWIRAIVEQCRTAGLPVFVKQDSGPKPGKQGRIPDALWIHEWPDGRACQQTPKGAGARGGEAKTMMELTIDPEFQGLIPPLTPEQHAQLKANLRAEGCRDPLVVWAGEQPTDLCPSCPPGTPFARATALIEAREGAVVWQCGFCDHGERRPWTLLDGHHRYAICQAHNLDFHIVEAPTWVVTREDVLIWIIRNQFARRNLEPYQRAELVLKLEPLIAAKAKAHQQQAGGAVPQKLAEAVDTRETLAQMANVSHETMRKAKAIAQEADESTKEALRRGERTIHRIYKELRRPRPASNGKAVAEASSGGTTPAAGRRTKQLTGAMWRDRLAEVRQHFMQVEQSQRIENLARTWSPDVADGYREELAHLIEALRQVQQRIDVVIRARVDGEPQLLMARRLIELADGIQHELATWRQQFPEDSAVHAFGLMEKHLHELRDFFRMKQRERIEHGASIEVPTDGGSASIPSEEPTTKGDNMAQALSREHEPGAAADAPAAAPIETEATDQSPFTRTVLGSCHTRKEARDAAHLWRERGRTVRVVRISNDEAETERPWHVVEVPPARDSAGIPPEAPTSEGDKTGELSSQEAPALRRVNEAISRLLGTQLPQRRRASPTKRPQAKKQAKRARAKTPGRKGTT
jgi:protein gp37